MDETRLPKRIDVKTEHTWKTEDLYPTVEDWKKEYESLSEEYTALAGYKGKLGTSAGTLREYLELRDRLILKLDRLYVYAGLRSHEDLGDSRFQDLANKAEKLNVLLSGAISFDTPEILKIGTEKIERFLQEDPGLLPYRHTLFDILRMKEHTLSEEMENMLSKVGEFSNMPGTVFSMINNADIRFPEVQDENGNPVTLTHGKYSTMMESTDRKVRKGAFQGLYQAFGAYKNTLAATYRANVEKELFYADVRHYDSPRQMHLDENAIDLQVYDSLIDTVHNYLPLMYEYVALRKKVLGVEELHLYDGYVSMVRDVNLKFTFEEAKQTVLEGLRPLGEDYLALLKEGFENRWIDVYENEGKRSGAYSWGVYGVHPYVLLNFRGTLNHVFTLAHEMGHSLHSYYSNTAQDYNNAGYCIFVAEVASTCNEVLLMHHFLNTSKDKNVKAAVLNYYLDTIKSTLFRQTMFAEFEKITYDMAAKGETLTAETLCRVYHELNELYFGPDMVIDPEIDMEWARIPHFYTPFYVYQYATGISAASAFAKQILEEGEPAVQNYKDKFLKAGCSKYPIEILADAGVDMRTGEPVEKTLETFREVLEQLKELV